LVKLTPSSWKGWLQNSRKTFPRDLTSRLRIKTESLHSSISSPSSSKDYSNGASSSDNNNLLRLILPTFSQAAFTLISLRQKRTNRKYKRRKDARIILVQKSCSYDVGVGEIDTCCFFVLHIFLQFYVIDNVLILLRMLWTNT
jgi:hypothetical protein